jgi:Uma2 family endonuclease
MVTSMRWTIADVAALPDIREDCRYEIIDGELSVSTQPDWRHQFVASEIQAALNRWSRPVDGGLALFAPGVIFSPENAVAPDVVWVRRERFAAVLGSDGKLHSAPDLMVELLSPGSRNIRRDREAKLALYSRWGVLEYWLVDWPTRRIEVYRRRDAHLHLIETLHAGDVITSPNLPGFATCVSEFFAQIPSDLRDVSAGDLEGDDE